MQIKMHSQRTGNQVNEGYERWSSLGPLLLKNVTNSSRHQLSDAHHHNIIHLMYGPEGNSQFCFPESPDVTREEVEGNISTQGKTKLTSFPRDHALSVLLYI